MDVIQPPTLAKHFYFDTFAIEPEQDRISFTYTTDAGHAFTHELAFIFPVGADMESLEAAAFALGMSELVHFWKTILAPEIVIKAGKLSPEQIAFWETLYTKGLGEFFYVNRIDFRGLVHITNDPHAPELLPATNASWQGRRALVPFGGGKDSIVTGELLRKQGRDFAWFELEPLPFGSRLREVSGVTECISIGRNVAKNFAPIIELVKNGAPNGHVPITATYIMSAAFAAQAHGFGDIVMSLERSANEGNVEYLGMDVNHQYSKSYEFETAAAEYIRDYVNADIRLFSLIRPLYELQIVREFVQYPKYFPYFVSCNRGLKTGAWCGECAKCIHVRCALGFSPAGYSRFNLQEKSL